MSTKPFLSNFYIAAKVFALLSFEQTKNIFCYYLFCVKKCFLPLASCSFFQQGKKCFYGCCICCADVSFSFSFQGSPFSLVVAYTQTHTFFWFLMTAAAALLLQNFFCRICAYSTTCPNVSLFYLYFML